ncbi:hypothetical protein D0Z07_0034 [Hyphodiscus hymeniophilus]|uniref:Uncharacterized protein n=1 Tax=Hyphodiscus hymeniophilus TaxID=353542 RepID=A0A9P6VSK6_9HELO|nr:hypothetical protein D0Z07_0034 [Hyphodiscus hymeniophilus]
MRPTTRVGASICLSVFSLVSIVLLLPSTRVSTQLQKITLGATLDDIPSLWLWGSTEDHGFEVDGVRLVVFGDSWVDDGDDGDDGVTGGTRGTSWAEALCEEVNCTSHLNFAVSQAIDSYPSSAPTGAITSNVIYASALATSIPNDTLVNGVLPDLAAQIQQFIALPSQSTAPIETLFIVSFGFWDIYHFADLDYGLGQNITDKTVDELFKQLDILYSHYSQNLSSSHSDGASNITERSHTPLFRVIIPKLFEPALLPGWISQRPVPLSPSSVAESQKNAAYLTSRWNLQVENKISSWIKDDPLHLIDTSAKTTEEIAALPIIERDVFYYDLAQYLLDIIVEHQLEDEGLSDASGLGKGDSPYESVYEACVHDADDSGEDGVDLHGQIVCTDPEVYLFWDSFNLGSVASEGVGKEVGKMVKQGKSMREMWSRKGS